MINKPPAFQFYADDFLGGTITMSLDERGLYVTLLCLQWSRGYVTQDDAKRMAPAMAQPSLSHVLAKFDEHENGQLKNKRLELEREKQASFRVSRSKLGKAGASKRWHGHSLAMAPAIAPAIEKHGSPVSSLLSPDIDTDICAREVELPAKFPKTEVEAKAAASFVGCTDEFAVETWNKAMSRHGRDAKDIPIRSWRHYLATEAKYQRNREAEKATKKQPESKQLRETIEIPEMK